MLRLQHKSSHKMKQNGSKYSTFKGNWVKTGYRIQPDIFNLRLRQLPLAMVWRVNQGHWWRQL